MNWEGGASVSAVRGKYQSGLVEGVGSGPYHSATQLSLSRILLRAWQSGSTRIQENVTAGNPESGASKSPVRGGTRQVHGKVDELLPPPNHTTQLLTPLNMTIPLYSGPGDILLSRHKLCRVVQHEEQRVGLFHSHRLMLYE